MNQTPNFNLIQPEAIDLFKDFLAWYNQNLAIIDANLGGGGSKHTIVDENGQALPNRTYLEFTGGVQVTDDALNNKTVVDVTGGGGGSSTLAGLSDVNLQTPTDGQVLTYDNASQKWINANPSGGGGEIYSTAEQVVGAWIDGKPIYQKTYELPYQITIGSNVNLTSFMTDISAIVDRFIIAFGYGNTAKSVNTFYIQNYNSQISAWSNLTFDVNIITVQYTKTTD